MRAKVIFLLAAAIFLAQVVFAQAPKDIEIYKDVAAKQIKIMVWYPMSSPRDKYIKKIEVIIDEQVPLAKSFNVQRGPYQEMSVSLPDTDKVKVIKVIAYPKSGPSLEKNFDFENIKTLEEREKRDVSVVDQMYE